MKYYLGCAAVFVVTYSVNMILLSVFYHRAGAHGALRVSPRLQRLVSLFGIWFSGLDFKGWVCMHRIHHKHTDREGDPHSPVLHGVLGVLPMQLYSYKRVLRGLILKKREYASVVADLDIDIHWLNRHRLWALPYIAHLAIAVAIGVCWNMPLLGASYWIGLMSHPVQGWLVNSIAHSVGYRNFETDDQSRNNTLIGLLLFGEGYHNNHHRFPASAKFSCRWFEFDLGYAVARVLELAGLLSVRRETLIPEYSHCEVEGQRRAA